MKQELKRKYEVLKEHHKVKEIIDNGDYWSIGFKNEQDTEHEFYMIYKNKLLELDIKDIQKLKLSELKELVESIEDNHHCSGRKC